MRQGQGFLIVYSIADKASFERLQDFYSNIYRVKEDEIPKGSKIPIIIVGNKCDLEQHRVVTTEQGQEYAKSIGCQFIETSAKTRTGVEEAYFNLVKKIREISPKVSRGVPWDESKKRRNCTIL
jgi:GTPase KRas protein